MDNPMTPRLVELVTRAQAIAKALNYIAGLARQMEVRQGCHKAMLESDFIASALSRLMAEGGLVGAASPAASLEELVKEVLGPDGEYIGLEGCERALCLFSRLAESHWFNRARTALLQANCRPRSSGAPPMRKWTGTLSRVEAVRILDRATDQDDPYWEGVVEDHYDEKADTMPSIMDVLAALGVTEAEYREASGADNVEWPKEPHP